MHGPTLGLVTIGQSPRDDIRPAYAAVLGPGVRIEEAGALDGMTEAAIARLAPSADDVPLVTLASGREVRIGKRAITPLVQRGVDAVAAHGATAVAVLCTGHFEGLHADMPLIEPDRVLRGFLHAILPSGRVGVIMPDEGQAAMMQHKWRDYDTTLATASPYQPPTQWDVVIEDFIRARVQAIVLDCMGFGPEAKAYFAARTHVPVLCAQTATAHLIRDLLWEPAPVLA